MAHEADRARIHAEDLINSGGSNAVLVAGCSVCQWLIDHGHGRAGEKPVPPSNYLTEDDL